MAEIDMTIPDIAPAVGAPHRAAGSRISQVTSFTLVGVEARTVCVEVSVRNGYPRTAIVGLPDASVLESRERVEAAIKASGLPFPDRRITINLSPAELPKEGTIFDLPVALAILAEEGRVPRDALAGWAIAGELSLDGTVRQVRGVLAMALQVAAANESTATPAGPSQSGRGRRRLLVPLANAVEATCVDGVEVVPVAHLREAVDAVMGRWPMHDMPRAESRAPSVQQDLDLSDLRGQSMARRALEVAVAGGHNLLLIGPPGGGKTLLAQRIAGILPPMTRRESLETTLIYSAAGMIQRGCGLIEARPFRAPHASVSPTAVTGGGSRPHPGEVSLAHNGVLFLDEMPQFSPSALNALRQPLEDGRISVARVRGVATFPARFMLVAAMNPCPCG